MNTRRNGLFLSLLATVTLAMSLPAHADRNKHEGRHSDQSDHSEHRGHGRGHYDRGHYKGHHDRHWRAPRHWYGHDHAYYRPRPVYRYAPPPRFLYVAHGVYGYHEHCSHGYDYEPAPVYGSGLSLWLDGVGFSYYERGW